MNTNSPPANEFLPTYAGTLSVFHMHLNTSTVQAISQHHLSVNGPHEVERSLNVWHTYEDDFLLSQSNVLKFGLIIAGGSVLWSRKSRQLKVSLSQPETQLRQVNKFFFQNLNEK